MAYNDPTTNYGWNLPNPGGDSGAWGGMLNEIFGNAITGIDAVLKAASNLAAAALPKSGGAMSGRIDSKTQAHTVVNLGSLSGAVTVDLSAGNVFHGSVTGTVTSVSFTNIPSGGVFCSLELTGGGAHSIAWPSVVRWPGGAAPALSASGVDVLTFYTRDGGANIRGALAMAGSR